MADNVNHPSHYETGQFECIDVMVETQGVEATMNFCVCNALKYIYRHKRKNGIEDIPARVIRTDGAVEDLMLHVKGLTDDEKEIILDGCLMNYYAKRN